VAAGPAVVAVDARRARFADLDRAATAALFFVGAGLGAAALATGVAATWHHQDPPDPAHQRLARSLARVIAG